MFEDYTRFRFGEDAPEELFADQLLEPDATLNAELRHHYLSNSLRVSAGITPRLAKLIGSVVENLKFGVRLESFIFADSHPNAFCAPAPNAEYAYIMISSELVNLMSDGELQFIIGHELGHFMFEHYRHPPHSTQQDLSKLLALKLSRASEISADRIGGLATPRIEDGISALIKLASGLPSSELSLNVGDLLQQVRDLDSLGPTERSLSATHPPLPLRAKALLRFQNSEHFCDFRENGSSAAFSHRELDSHVAKDIEGHHSPQLDSMGDSAIKKFVLWTAILLFAADRHISKQERQALENIAGAERVGEIMKVLPTMSIGKLELRVQEAADAILALPSAFKQTALAEVSQLVELSSSENPKILTFIRSSLEEKHG